jgi:frataxin-like iron-binding protein CyaY
VEEHLKDMMQELGNAINESLSESERIAAAIAEIKQAGYEVFLVLEATIGFNKREPEQDTEIAAEAPGIAGLEVRPARVKWTSQDQKFLKALKIAVDDETRS